MADFSQALDYLTPDEGGLSPDGLTKYGITVEDARSLGYTGDMKDFPYSLAPGFYQTNFWAPLGLDGATAQGPATAIFDMAVLTGLGGAGVITQNALADLGWNGTMDGAFGPETLAGVNGMDPNAFVSTFADQAEAYLRALAGVAQNPGWITRAERLATLQTGVAGALAQVTTHPTTTAIIVAFILFGFGFFRGRS